MESLTAKVGCHNLALTINEDVGGDAAYAVGFGGGTLPALEVGDVMPFHANLLDGLLPCVALLVEADTHHVESLGMIFLVGCHHIGHLGTTRTAPRSPEVNEHVVALANPLAELALLALSVVHREVGEHGSGHALLQTINVFLGACHQRVIVISNVGIENLSQLLVGQFVFNDAKDSNRGEIVFVSLDIFVLQLYIFINQCVLLSLYFLNAGFCLGSVLLA